MSSKHQKAATLLNAGHPIEVIAEADFLRGLAATEGLSLGRVGRSIGSPDSFAVS
jgi:hypothetical protein